MGDKNIALGFSTLGIWLGGILAVVLGTVALPFVFLYTLFIPEGPSDVFNNLLESITGVDIDGSDNEG